LGKIELELKNGSGKKSIEFAIEKSFAISIKM